MYDILRMRIRFGQMPRRPPNGKEGKYIKKKNIYINIHTFTFIHNCTYVRLTCGKVQVDRPN